jgi:hypothetical protein
MKRLLLNFFGDNGAMSRRLVRVIGVMVVLVLLLAVFAGAAWGDEGETLGSTDDGAEEVDGAALICLALVGGTALLAGGVWMGQMRRMLS